MNVVLVGGACDGRRLTWEARGNPRICVSSLPRMRAYADYNREALMEVQQAVQVDTYRIVACHGDWAVAIPEHWDTQCGLRELVRGYHEERQHCN